MSNLTRMLKLEQGRTQMTGAGAIKTPVVMNVPVPPQFEEVCISLRLGGFHVVQVQPNRETRTGFFNLPMPFVASEDSSEGAESEDRVELDLYPPSEDEDRVQASLVKFLHEHGIKSAWGGAVSASSLDVPFLMEIHLYFQEYGLELDRVFCGVVGLSLLHEAGLVQFPEEVEMEDLTHDTFTAWMGKYFHVGRVGVDDQTVPVYYNPYMLLDVAFCAAPETVGHMYRVDERAAILVHNPERGCVTVRALLSGGDEDVS